MVRKITAEKEAKRRKPNIQYATEKHVRAAAKLASITHGQAFRQLANRQASGNPHPSRTT